MSAAFLLSGRREQRSSRLAKSERRVSVSAMTDQLRAIDKLVGTRVMVA